ncbi:MAG: endonuclease/exonuclease/phosphatase family protein [Bacteroidia bacterium]|nr:endonuclease/exonuclease/phosphatase family protein [Bacteroidia bacterium]
MNFWRIGGLILALLWVLSWFIPPWGWGVPFLTAIIWTYGGGIYFLIGILRDGSYKWLWSIAFVVWTVSLQFIWRLLPSEKSNLQTIRVATFNMDAAHYKRPQIELLADSLRHWHPQILCLQEVYFGDYTPAEFARRLGYDYYAFLDAKMHMGMLILSDYKIEKTISHELLHGTTNGFHEAWIRLPSGESARILNIHFPSYRLRREGAWQWKWLNRIWAYQERFYGKLRQTLVKNDGKILWLCGDFNTLPFHPLYLNLSRKLYDSHMTARWGTGPTWLHLLRIDYIWSSLPAASHEIRWLPGQEHAYIEAGYRLSAESVTFAQTGR